MVALPDLIIAEAVVASGGASAPDSAPRLHPQLLFYQRRARRRALTLRTYHAGVCRGVAGGGHVRGKTARVPGCIRLAGNRDCPCDGAYGIPSRGASAGHPLCDQRLLLFPSSTPRLGTAPACGPRPNGARVTSQSEMAKHGLRALVGFLPCISYLLAASVASRVPHS
jgi:hypothetical protein